MIFLSWDSPQFNHNLMVMLLWCRYHQPQISVQGSRRICWQRPKWSEVKHILYQVTMYICIYTYHWVSFYKIIENIYNSSHSNKTHLRNNVYQCISSLISPGSCCCPQESNCLLNLSTASSCLRCLNTTPSSCFEMFHVCFIGEKWKITISEIWGKHIKDNYQWWKFSSKCQTIPIAKSCQTVLYFDSHNVWVIAKGVVPQPSINYFFVSPCSICVKICQNQNVGVSKVKTFSATKMAINQDQTASPCGSPKQLQPWQL